MGRRRAAAVLFGSAAALAACGLEAVTIGPTIDAGDGGDADAHGDVVVGADAPPDDAATDAPEDALADAGCEPCPAGFVCEKDVCTDRAVDHFTIAANPSGNWTWAYRLADASAPSATVYPTSFTDAAHDGIEIWSRAIGSTTPAVYFNPSASTVHPFGTFTMAPEELAFHPGPTNEKSVVRWTAPAAREYRARIVVRGLSGWNGAPTTTTGVTVWKGASVIATVQVDDADAGVAHPIVLTPTPFAAGEAIDVSVDYGSNGNYGFDSTGIDAVVFAP